VNTKIIPNKTEKIDFSLPIKKNTPGTTVVRIFIESYDDKLNDDTIAFKTIVLPAPGGSLLSSSSKSTKALYQPSKTFDVTVLNQPVIYDFTSPRAFGNADYNATSGANKGWRVSTMAFTKSKRSISGSSFTAPNASNQLEVQFATSDSTLEDSTITLAVKYTDNASGCDTVINRDILIYPSIKPNFTPPLKICDNDNVLFENRSAVRSGSMEFLWDFGTGNPGDTSNAPEPVFVFPKKGTYNVKLTAKTMPYGFAFSNTISVTVNEIPAVQFTRENACEGQKIILKNLTTPSNSQVLWNFGNGTQSNTWSPSVKYAKAGTYLITLSANLNGCNAFQPKEFINLTDPLPNSN